MSADADDLAVLDLARLVELRRLLPPPSRRRALRLAADVPLEAVARHCHVTRQAVSSWERGTREPRGENLVAYVDALNLLRASA